ncbi:MAG: long-chain fatty acid--CoA ligase [Kineosporiaceae bacterium]|nr:long-chain fatty acid--CoA ligase [Kineosporiaceae bacterium]MBK8077228.1 long-chain fatty acid--CoA ligase [Kineosporiaceae bacterium]
MRSTMPDFPLTIRHILEHGRDTYPDSQVVTATRDSARRIDFVALAARAGQLANGLARLGIGPGDRVGTFAWNAQEHQEAYLAVPCSGAVLHTVNIRLDPEHIAYIINHAEDRALLVDASLAPALAPALPKLTTVKHLIVFGDGDRSLLPGAIEYEDLLDGQPTDFAWPDLPESTAAAMCYTSGTTGPPKGVVYSHRSTFLHSLGVSSGEALGLNQRDRVLPVVPMFHGNAWGLPYACWMVGADLVLPGAFASPPRLARLIADEQVTMAAAVPTVWWDMLGLGSDTLGLDSLRMIMCGGAAVPRALIEAYQSELGVLVVQGWGLTETSPVASLAFPPKHATPEQSLDLRATAGQVLGGVEVRITGSEGEVLARDGVAVGEIEVRGPWVTQAYYLDPTPDKFHDGWLRTGDVGSIDPRGFVRISDRAKDVVKSGGEWISSLDLEAALLEHPAVREVAVIAAPDQRWGERPLACVVTTSGARVTPEELREFLTGRVARWWLPEKWTFIDEVPRTSVGKYDKKLLRARLADGELDVRSGGPAPGQSG